MTEFLKKILIIGSPNNNETHFMTGELAARSKTINHGLINQVDADISKVGYYHTTVADLLPGQIIHIAKNFNLILLLDQDNYDHFKVFVTTFRLMQDLEEQGFPVKYKTTKAAKRLYFWKKYLQENKSFCAFPFVSMHNNRQNGMTTLCSKSHASVANAKDIIDWSTNSSYTKIRSDMLNGIKTPEFCQDCYDREAEQQESTRQFETLEWVARIKADDPNDFLKIKNPLFYEIWPSNKCNIMCRTCFSNYSHLIEAESKITKIPISTNVPFAYHDPIKDEGFLDAQRIYWGGGEPTINPDFYSFLRKCINLKHTSFELMIGTNGMKISNTLLDLLDHFNNVTFCFSFDGYDKVNDYIRWGSNFNQIVENSRLVRQRGHVVSKQTVFSMYSISRMHEVFEFYDREFPEVSSSLLVQVGTGFDDLFMPFNHPCPDIVAESMEKCMKTDIYYMNGRSLKSQIDLTYNYYSDPNYKCNLDKLIEFYHYNDKLDAARGSNLKDYIPELAQARKTYNL